MPAHALTVMAAGMRVVLPQSFSPVFARTLVYSRPGRAHAGRGPPAENLS
jgi:hypothetical protein